MLQMYIIIYQIFEIFLLINIILNFQTRDDEMNKEIDFRMNRENTR